MAQLNLKSQLETLVRLQEVDSQIYDLTEEKRAQPLEIEALKNAFEEKKKNLAAQEKGYLDAQKEKKDRELELQTQEENVKKLQTQLYQLKTNKEYSAMLGQINDAKADASTIEDRILESMDKIERSRSSVEEEKKKLQAEEGVFNAQKQKIEQRIKEIDDQLARLGVQRKEILPDIDKTIISQYERILKNREGLAIVAVKNNTCSGCNMLVPPQVINMIQMYERIITCEVCNRILFIPHE
ncbi:MAG TPA: C4-type zinc ribbon domain-containing protein [Candidatus Omnitrophota bacterium]|nr:C4-type zinc ribbon domain-containing protein [Candidatus Omnitrophota bacterium]HRZ15075.1 C4-type zinc ribbon domain-containing protein [Candidatus Omnitrophota bacterium]